MERIKRTMRYSKADRERERGDGKAERERETERNRWWRRRGR